jgi:nicotinate-nucleotide adenylyltransferase
MSFAAPARHGRSILRAPGPVARGLRIGLLGGSFNPAHDGHLHASEVALKQLGLDYVWWLVSPQNPLKPEQGMTEFGERLAAAKRFAHHPRIVVTGIEADLGTRYTIDTLNALKHRFPQIRFVWLMGTDNLVQFPRWQAWQAIAGLVPIAVVTRPGTALSARCAKAAIRFRGQTVPADRLFPCRNPPALALLEAKRNFTSATRLRAAGASLKR